MRADKTGAARDQTLFHLRSAHIYGADFKSARYCISFPRRAWERERNVRTREKMSLLTLSTYLSCSIITWYRSASHPVDGINPRFMKTLVKTTACALYKYSGLMAVHEGVRRWAGKGSLSVLMLHRVTDEIKPDGLTVSMAFFRAMCGRLRRNFRVVPLSEIFRIINQGEPLPPRTLAITFDDCYRETVEAARILGEHQLPACFFLTTALIEPQGPVEPRLRFMTEIPWADAKEILRLGHEIGSHTVTHPDMAQLSADQARQELADSKKTLERHLERPVRWLAYPFGGPQHFRAECLQMAYELGYEGVVSGHGGFIRPGMAGQILPRVPVPSFSSLLNLELHLTGCLDWWYGLKRWVRAE